MSIWGIDEENIRRVEIAFHKLTGRTEIVSDMVIFLWFSRLTESEQLQIMCGEWDENRDEAGRN